MRGSSLDLGAQRKWETDKGQNGKKRMVGVWGKWRGKGHKGSYGKEEGATSDIMKGQARCSLSLNCVQNAEKQLPDSERGTIADELRRTTKSWEGNPSGSAFLGFSFLSRVVPKVRTVQGVQARKTPREPSSHWPEDLERRPLQIEKCEEKTKLSLFPVFLSLEWPQSQNCVA